MAHEIGRQTRLLFIVSVVFGVGASALACSSDTQSDDVNDAAGNFSDAGATAQGGGRNGSGGSTAQGGDRNGSGGSAASGLSSAAGTTANSGGTAGSATTDTQCNNGIDDDGDGLIDGFDAECVGPLDNDESSFATGIPGDNRDPKWQDCFFDGNSGAGDDGCRYATECLYGTLAADDKDCTLTQACVDFCRPLTQNGCDCFGCCTVQLSDGSNVDILQAGTCSLAKVEDEQACPRCTKSTQCKNECGECELCPGKTLADLPSHCSDSPGGAGGASGTGGNPGSGGSGTPPPGNTCDDGQQVCGPGLPACPGSHYCSLGCCIVTIR